MSEHLTGEQRRVLDWADAARRDLPWRRTRDPWSVLVAEVMLQQTQVERVVPRWHAFLERFPTTEACAAAPLADVLVEWSGLGYPRRARNLHLTAAAVEASGGTIPDRLDALLGFPGIGPYTARAVLAFAFEQDVAVLDTNVGRVLARRAGRSLRPRRGAGRGRRMGAPRPWVGLEPGPAGPGGDAVPAVRTGLHRVPGASDLPVGPLGLGHPRPGIGLGRGVHRPGPVRGVVPPGPGPAAPGAAPGPGRAP